MPEPIIIRRKRGARVSPGPAPEPATIGTIYEKSSWANLDDFTEFGTSGASIVGDNIQFTGGSGVINGLTLNVRKTLLEKTVYQSTFSIDHVIGASTQGPGFELRSIHPVTGSRHSVLCRFNTTSDAGTGGTVRLLSTADQATYSLLVASPKLTISQNDIIRVTVTRQYFTVTALAENITTGLSESCTYTFDASSSATLPNTYRFSITNAGGTFTIQSITITSGENKNVGIVCVGDSKTQGRQANVYTARFSDLLKSNGYSVVNLGGPSDRTVEIVQIITEITEINASNIIFCIGRNDLAFGISSAVWQPNLDLLESSFAGKNIVFLTIEPDVQDQTALISYIQGKGWQYVRAQDVDLSADNIHPNAAGHAEVHSALVASGLIN